MSSDFMKISQHNQPAAMSKIYTSGNINYAFDGCFPSSAGCNIAHAAVVLLLYLGKLSFRVSRNIPKECRKCGQMLIRTLYL